MLAAILWTALVPRVYMASNRMPIFLIMTAVHAVSDRRNCGFGDMFANLGAEF